MRKEESGVLPVWCPFYGEDSGKSILLTQIKEGETPGKELGELAKVMKQAVEIRQELQGEGAGQERGVRVVFAGQAEEFSE